MSRWLQMIQNLLPSGPLASACREAVEASACDSSLYNQSHFYLPGVFFFFFYEHNHDNHPVTRPNVCSLTASASCPRQSRWACGPRDVEEFLHHAPLHFSVV